jgi:hypothetical protein
MRVQGKSAEAVVVKIALETGKERRAEEPQKSGQPTIFGSGGKKDIETEQALQLRQPPALAQDAQQVDSCKCGQAR